MKNKMLFALLTAACISALLVAQPPAPAPISTAATTVTGSISQFNYEPNGRVEGFVVTPNTLLSLPPDWAIQVELLSKIGDRVRVTGFVTPAASGMQIMEPQILNVSGRTLSVVEPSQPVPYAGSGVIRFLNYGRQGEINGFVLQNGIIARTPPIGTSDVSVVRPGTSISISGFAQSTPTGRTVVEVQSITANGQTIAMNSPPRESPGRRPAGKRGPRGVALPPPPGPPMADAPPPPPPDR